MKRQRDQLTGSLDIHLPVVQKHYQVCTTNEITVLMAARPGTRYRSFLKRRRDTICQNEENYHKNDYIQQNSDRTRAYVIGSCIY